MSAVSGLGTIFNLPQYVGSIMLGAATDTAFLDAIGGLAWNDPDLLTHSVLFQWGVVDLPDPDQPAILEGADATFSEQSGVGPFNVVQIFQEAVEVSYSRQASYMTLAPATSSFTAGGDAAIVDILAHQIKLKMPKIRNDVNYSLLRGSYQLPANNASGRKTRGLMNGISTNVTAAGGDPLDETMVLDMIQQVFDARGVVQEWEPTIIVGGTKKREITTIFVRNAQFQQTSRRVGGANCQAIESDFGLINVMTDRMMAADTVGFAHLRLCRPRFMPVPGKGVFFAEPLAKTGSSDRYQIYGEVGLEYGDEVRHAKITGLA